MEQHLAALGVTLCGELQQHYGLLHLLFSEATARHFLRVSLGLGQTDLSDMAAADRKSISAETTFSGTQDKQQFLDILSSLCQQLHKGMVKKNLLGKVFTLKMKTVEFVLKTRSQCLGEPTQDYDVMINACRRLLQYEIDKCAPTTLALRLLGVRMSTLSEISQTHLKQMKISNMLAKISSTTSYENTNKNSEDCNSCMSSMQESSAMKINAEDFNDKSNNSMKYQCPICDQVIFTKFLNTFNKHIDECLQKESINETDVNTQCSINQGEHNSSPSYNHITIPTNSNKLEHETNVDELAASNHQPLANSFGKPVVTSVNETLKVTAADGGLLACPVCSTAQFTCPIKLNKHLDECLSLTESQQLDRSSGSHHSSSVICSGSLINKRKQITAGLTKNKKQKTSNSIKNYFT